VRARDRDSGHRFAMVRSAIGNSSKWIGRWDNDKQCCTVCRYGYHVLWFALQVGSKLLGTMGEPIYVCERV
jgi:hypothetical protein